jgi:hypothetical protein
LILTDKLSSVKVLLSRKISPRTHSLVYECKQICSDLLEDGVEVVMICIPAHMDERVRHAFNGAVFERPLSPVDFQDLERSVLLRKWQGK